jgi:hypothetical protein
VKSTIFDLESLNIGISPVGETFCDIFKL